MQKRRGRRMSGTVVFVFLAATCFVSGCGESKSAKEARTAGIEQLNAGQYEMAVASFETALEEADGIVDEFELDILKYRAEAEYKIGDYEAAAHTYQILAEVDGEKREYAEWKNSAELQALNRQGLELLEQKQPEEALAVFQEGLDRLSRTDSNIANAEELAALFSYNIGAAYEAQGEFEQALSQFQSYVSSYGASPELLKELAFLENCLDGSEEWQN